MYDMTTFTHNICSFKFIETFYLEIGTIQNSDALHDLTIGHCNIQGGFLNVGKTTHLTQLIRDHKLDILSLNGLTRRKYLFQYIEHSILF